MQKLSHRQVLEGGHEAEISGNDQANSRYPDLLGQFNPITLVQASKKVAMLRGGVHLVELPPLNRTPHVFN
jgi:hypothetical protein